MRKTRSTKRISTSSENYSSSDDDEPIIKKTKKSTKTKKTPENENTSSSESDIENYLQPVDEIDFTSSFFNVEKKVDNVSFDKIENNIFAGITRLSDSDSDTEIKEAVSETQDNNKNKPITTNTANVDEKMEVEPAPTAKLNFQQLQEYTNKIEEAKKYIERYKAKKESEDNKIDISNLLAAGESQKSVTLENITAADLHSSDFESCDSEKEDWEEVKIKDNQENKGKRLVPQDGLQITVNMPDAVKKKKGVDLLAAMKRRLNRIRKENQVYVHKVHLLCWVAHGNFINSNISKPEVLGMALSLLPSEQCYPSNRTDLGYLEKIVEWYKRTVKLNEKDPRMKANFSKSLETQINKKEVYDTKSLVYIFIAILRALGIQCRLVLSLQVEPLRPPASALHSLSTKSEDKKGDTKGKESGSGEKPKEGELQKKKNEGGKKDEIKKVSKTGDNTSRGNKENKGIEKKIESKWRASTISKTEEANLKNKKTDTKSKSTNDKSGKDQDNKKASKCSSEVNKTSKDSNKKESTDEANDKKLSKAKSSTSNTLKTHKTSQSSNDKDKLEVPKRSIRNRSKSSELSTNEPEDKNSSNSKKRSTKNSLTADRNSKPRSKTANIDKDQLEIPEKTRRSISKSKEPPNGESQDKIKDKPSRSKKDTTNNALKVDKTTKARSKSATNKDQLDVPKDVRKGRSKSSENTEAKNNSKEIIKIKLPAKKKEDKKIPQMDGNFDSDSESESEQKIAKFPQLDGNNDDAAKNKSKKPNLNKLKKTDEKPCPIKDHPKRLKSIRNSYKEDNSDDDFEKKRSPFTKKNLNSNPKVNLQKLNKTPIKLSSPGTSTGGSKYYSSPTKASRFDVTNDIMNLVKGRIAEQKQIDRSKMMKKRKSTRNVDDDSDSDYAPEPIKKKHHDSDDEFVPKVKVKKRVQVKKVSSEEENKEKDGKKKKRTFDVWAEVFLETEEKWISVDLVYGQVHCVNELYARATHPVSYVVAWNNDNTLKDVTARYCPNFDTVTRKLRIDSKWWLDSLQPFVGKKTARDREEDEELARQQLEKPLPKAISEYKNHPLYVLKRHLLKFEAIYPPDPVTLGFVRGEPVYSRSCVYTLHSRDIWLKHAKVVKPGEKPYKIVKARPKYDKLSNSVITDQLLEIFGPWQVEDYVPPTAENGVVPRNAFGNVELFKPCMLPKKTVHLKLPGLNKIARRMNIDCASAIVGFDFHGGWSHPTYDGFVVCEEFEDVLVAAWEVEQEEIEKKEQEKIDKRVYGNWKKLIKGLLIRERLKARYDFGEPSTSGGKEKKKLKGPRFCTKKRRICSDSESESDGK